MKTLTEMIEVRKMEEQIAKMRARLEREQKASRQDARIESAKQLYRAWFESEMGFSYAPLELDLEEKEAILLEGTGFCYEVIFRTPSHTSSMRYCRRFHVVEDHVAFLSGRGWDWYAHYPGGDQGFKDFIEAARLVLDQEA